MKESRPVSIKVLSDKRKELTDNIASARKTINSQRDRKESLNVSISDCDEIIKTQEMQINKHEDEIQEIEDSIRQLRIKVFHEV